MKLDLVTAPTAKTPLGTVDLVPFLRRDAGEKKVELPDEREAAALAFSVMPGWTAERIANATGLHTPDVRALQAKHLPAPEPVHTPAAAPERKGRALPVHTLVGGSKRNSRTGHGVDWNTKELICALRSMNERKDAVIKQIVARNVEVCEDLEQARDWAVQLEQQLAQVHSHLREIYEREMADPENGAVVARECLDRFGDVTQSVLNDMVAAREGQSA